MALSEKAAELMLNTRLAEAEHGVTDAYYDLGVSYSTGSDGVAVDLIEAHKWFNLAALNGDLRGQAGRADISYDMTAREIAEAQRQARAWLSCHSTQRYAA